MSTVCRTFNSICIRILLMRNGDSEALFSRQAVFVSSPLLAALHLSFRNFPFERFRCLLGPSNFCRNLRFVREVMGRSKHLRSVHLGFEYDLFHAPTDKISRQALMSAVCGTVSAFAMRTGNPVFIFSGPDIFSCLPHDIAGWNLDLLQFNSTFGPRGLLKRARRTLNLEVPGPLDYLFTKIKLHTGEQRTVPPLVHLRSTTIESIRYDSRSLTILIFDRSSIVAIRLGQACRSIPPDDLSAAIAHVTLPGLRHVDISTDTIHPSALHLFLSRHPKIEIVRCHGLCEESSTRPVLDRPLVHPGFVEISVTSHGLGRVIASLIRSPKIHTFAFEFPTQLSAATLEVLLIDLRQISFRTNATTLVLNFACRDRGASATNFWSLSRDACEVAKTLHCVRDVLVLFFTVEDGLGVLSWLALLPAVTRIRFFLQFASFEMSLTDPEWAKSESEVAALVDRARTELPHVLDVTGAVY
ncbi:hypothetical protein DFH06DRAFT_1332793 [Mycena polygramma]|nr:hypothetical protein DFH06DRAFT_1332793 [Mycena polygramma]